MANEDNYPGLIESVSTELEPTLEARLVKLEERSNVHTKLFLNILEYDIASTAGEVLKQAVKKQGVAVGECLHYFDHDPEVRHMVFLACHAFGAFGPNPNTEDLASFKTISQEIIQARNDMVHFQELEALEGQVEKCVIAINEWPHLKAKYPSETRVILNYSHFKSMLPECFKTQGV